MEPEQKKKNRTWWIWVILVVAVVISLTFGLLVGGAGGFILGRKTAAGTGRAYRILPWGSMPYHMPGWPWRWWPQVPEREPSPEEKPETPSPRLPELPSFEQGAIVRWVEEGGPADRAGLREGDIITAIGGQPLSVGEDLATRIYSYDPGARVELTVLRNRQTELKIVVTLGSRRDERGRTVAYLGIKYSMMSGRD